MQKHKVACELMRYACGLIRFELPLSSINSSTFAFSFLTGFKSKIHQIDYENRYITRPAMGR